MKVVNTHCSCSSGAQLRASSSNSLCSSAVCQRKQSVVTWLRRSGGCVTRQVEAHGALAVSFAGQGPAWQVTLRGLHCSFRPPSRR